MPGNLEIVSLELSSQAKYAGGPVRQPDLVPSPHALLYTIPAQPPPVHSHQAKFWYRTLPGKKLDVSLIFHK